MTARNDVTGDLIATKSSDAYRNNYDAIFRKPQKQQLQEDIAEAQLTEEDLEDLRDHEHP